MGSSRSFRGKPNEVKDPVMNKTSRRSFVKAGLGVGAAMITAPNFISARSVMGKINLGVIGVYNRAAANLAGVSGENIVALCDVDESRATKARDQFPKAAFFQDFRKLLDVKGIDAVVVGTPDHVHAVQGIAAMRAGKHLYCEKPLAHSVLEVRAMIKTARANKLVTQMGTQIHAEKNYRRVVEIIQAGVIGEVKRVQVWQSSKPPVQRFAKEPPKIPQGFNYDLWLGPVPHKKYDPAFTHFNWRYFWEFGGGVFADMACHYMDLPHWALGLTLPTSVEAVSKRIQEGDQTVPDLVKAEYHYPARGKQPAVHLTWYNGCSGPGWEHDKPYLGYGSGVLFEGSKGKLISGYSKHNLLPEENFKNFTPPAPTIPDSIGHHKEWLEAIRGNGKTLCNFDYSGILAQSVLLGNVSLRSGQKITWDETRATTGSAKADAYLIREYRKGWEIPEITGANSSQTEGESASQERHLRPARRILNRLRHG